MATDSNMINASGRHLAADGQQRHVATDNNTINANGRHVATDGRLLATDGRHRQRAPTCDHEGLGANRSAISDTHCFNNCSALVELSSG